MYSYLELQFINRPLMISPCCFCKGITLAEGITLPSVQHTHRSQLTQSLKRFPVSDSQWSSLWHSFGSRMESTDLSQVVPLLAHLNLTLCYGKSQGLAQQHTFQKVLAAAYRPTLVFSELSTSSVLPFSIL